MTIKIPQDLKGGQINFVNSAGFISIRRTALELENVIDVADLPSGLYLINVSNKVKTIATKIIKE